MRVRRRNLILIAAEVIVVGAVIAVLERGQVTEFVLYHARGCGQDPNGWDGAGRVALHDGWGTNPERDPPSRWRPSWITHGLGTLSTPPAAAKGIVYSVRPDGTIVALHAPSGARFATLPAGHGEAGPVTLTPAIDYCDGVFVSPPDAAAGRSRALLRGVDLYANRLVWTRLLRLSHSQAPEIVAPNVYITGTEHGHGILEGLVASSGRPVLSMPTQSAALTSPASDRKSRLYVGDGVELDALTLSGRRVWRMSTG